MKIKVSKWLFVTFLMLFFLKFATEIIATTTHKAIDFNRDLNFIRKTLLEDHPGVLNSLDPQFIDKLEKNFRIARKKLLKSDSTEEKAKIMWEFGRSFDDGHLGIKYDIYPLETANKTQTLRPFGMQKIQEGVHWIDIPTFELSEDQENEFKDIINRLADLRQQTIIFDLRGNHGGNSAWGNRVLKALFGDQFVQQQQAKYFSKVYPEFRVTQGNLDHIHQIIAKVKKQFGEENDVSLYWQNVYQGMKDALSLNKPYYSAPSSDSDHAILPSNSQSNFSGHIIVIIDKGCGSACLDFIDGLKAMDSDLVFIGEPTGADSVYMELRKVTLPSGQGILGFPIKVYRNRPRGNNVPYLPDIDYKENLQDNMQLRSFVLNMIESLS